MDDWRNAHIRDIKELLTLELNIIYLSAYNVKHVSYGL
jgi:hypothetical protein